MADSDEKNKKGRTAIENIYKNILGDRITYNEPKYFFHPEAFSFQNASGYCCGSDSHQIFFSLIVGKECLNMNAIALMRMFLGRNFYVWLARNME